MNEELKDEIKKKIININRVEGIKKKDEESGIELLIGYNIFEKIGEKDVKYTLWFTKQDKTNTKAFSQYKGQGLNIGSSVGIAYKEAPNNFKFKDRATGEMKEAKSTNRTIMWFSEPSSIEEYDNAIERLGSDIREFSPNHEEVNDLGKNLVENPERDIIDVKDIPF